MEQKGGSTRVIRKSMASMLILSACFAVLVLLMLLALSPERYSLEVGDIAPKTITATKDVIDEATTELKRQDARAAVQSVYQEDETAQERVLANIKTYFDGYETVRAYGEKLRRGQVPSASGGEFTYNGSFLREDLDYAESLVAPVELSDWQLTILMKLSENELSATYTTTVSAVKKAMDAGIRQTAVETAISNIQRQIIQYISSDLCWNIAVPTVRVCLEPNMVVNEEATAANQEAAAAEVEPVYYKNGQNIVVAGERVTKAEIQVLETLGLLEGNKFDKMLFLGACMVGVLSLMALYFYMLRFAPEVLRQPRIVLMLSVIFSATTLITYFSSKLNPYFVPIAVVPLLVTALISPSFALAANLIALVLIGVVSDSTTLSSSQQILSILFSGIVSAPAGVFIMRRNQQRVIVFFAGFVMAVINVAGMLCVGLLTNNNISGVLNDALWCGGGTFLSAVLCIAFQPLLETMFNLVTPYKLLELANPNQPLLRRLLVETPGTYHHSIMVANLAEAAAEAIGANPLLARVAAYYHDIGKLKRPLYFKENQVGENPHDHTDPRVSAAILIEHVRDGVQLARHYHLPQSVIDCIEQHHGDSCVSYFYHKMLTSDKADETNADDFRYPGPKPQTLEAGILMMADTVEAAVRAGTDRTTEEIAKKIRELVKAKIDSGQLDETPLRLNDVTKIIDTFAQVMNGVYHQRIEYPKMDDGSARQPASRPSLRPGAIAARTAEKGGETANAVGNHGGENGKA